MDALYQGEAGMISLYLDDFHRTLIKRGWRLYLGRERRDGRNIPVYFFWCSVCSNFSKNFPQGYRHELNCSACRAAHSYLPKLEKLAKTGKIDNHDERIDILDEGILPQEALYGEVPPHVSWWRIFGPGLLKLAGVVLLLSLGAYYLILR